MDDLIRELRERAGLSEDQAKRAADVVAGLLKDEEKRKKIIAAAVTAATTSVVFSGSR
ncbi:MAG TPA: hypothetical protein VF071_07545 [Candidatus Limnocylindria bacterium]